MPEMTAPLNIESFATNQVVDRIGRPPALANMQGVIATYITTNALYPRYQPGDLVVVSSHRPARLLDPVMVLMTDRTNAGSQIIVARYMGHNDTTIVLRQDQPEEDIEIDQDAVLGMYRILTTNEILGA